MRRGSAGPGIPLVWKELLEIGSRRQTYTLRMVYAGLLFLAFLAFLASCYAPSADPLAMLGRGKDLFDFLVVFQFGAIYLVLPALVSGTIVEEKNRGCLELLVLSRMRPWQILAGKLLGRTLPVVSLLLLSMPLLAIAYAYGGITLDGFCLGIFHLGVACFQVGSISLLASALFRSATGAFLASYGLTAAVSLLIPVFGIIATRAGFPGRVIGAPVPISLFPIELFVHTQGESFLRGATRAVPALASGLACLILARLLLFRGVSRGPGGAPMRPLDAARWLLSLLCGGRSPGRERKSRPAEDEAVRWREAYRLGVGDRRQQLFLVISLVAVVLGVAALVVRLAAPTGPSAAGDVNAISYIVFALWALAALSTALVAVNAFIGESTRQTLDLLLATPLDGDELVFQKYLGIRRFFRVFWLPFATVFVLEPALELRGMPWTLDRAVQIGIYAASSALSVAVFLPSIAWLAMWVGLRSRNAVRALLGALIAMATLFLVPTCLWVSAWGIRRWHDHVFFGAAIKSLGILAVLIVFVSAVSGSIRPLILLASAGGLLYISPASAIFSTEYLASVPPDNRLSFFVAVALNLLVHLAIGQRVRDRCLGGADGYFGRI